MTITRIFTLLLLLWITSTAQTQTLSGTVTDHTTGQALPYVNIGWVNQNIGTVSSDQGHYTLPSTTNLPDSALLRFSMIGYQPQDFLWKDLRDRPQLNVALTPSVEKIEEIVIIDCTPKSRKKRGNPISKPPSAWMSFASKELGTEITTRVRLKKHRQSHIKALHFWVDNHDYDTLFFRLNVYAVEAGRPGQNLLRKNILVTFTAKDEKVTIDLEPYHLFFDQDVFVGFEYIRTLESDTESPVSFGGVFMGKSSFVRFTSQSRWIKTPILNLGFWLDVCEVKAK